jgi:hypothetical protein
MRTRAGNHVLELGPVQENYIHPIIRYARISQSRVTLKDEQVERLPISSK